jgi:hypothetical protein
LDSARYRFLEEEYPQRDLHSGILTLGFSTFELFKQKKFLLPLMTQVSVSAPFSGRSVAANPMVQAELVLFF